MSDERDQPESGAVGDPGQQRPTTPLPDSLARQWVDAGLGVASGLLGIEVDRYARQLGERYEIGEVVAEGGMGVIRAAADRNIGRCVAIKAVRADRRLSREKLLRFLREAQVTGRLEHPGIVPVHEIGVDDERRPYYAMKLVEGTTLAEILDAIAVGNTTVSAEYSLNHLLTIFMRACEAVAFAHSKGVIHRDLKPANVMVGGYGEVLVMDWGLAKVLHTVEGGGWKAEEQNVVGRSTPRSDPDPESPPGGASHISSPTSGGCSLDTPSVRHDADTPELTMDGQIMGTPAFMAPEQAHGDVDAIDERTDIYALGAILYNILTLRPPVEGRSTEEVLTKVRRGEIEPPTTSGQAGAEPSRQTPRPEALGHAASQAARAYPHCPGGRIPAALSAVAMRALALDPADRYQNAQELQREVEAHQAGFATAAEHAGFLRLTWLLVLRHRAACAVIAATTIAIIVGLAGMLGVSRAQQQRTRAQARTAEAQLALIKEQQRQEDAWIPVYETDFSDGTLDPRFRLEIGPGGVGAAGIRAPVPGEHPIIRNGMLEFRWWTYEAVESTLVWTEPLGDDVRLEIDAPIYSDGHNYRYSIAGSVQNGYRLVLYPAGDVMQLEQCVDGAFSVLDRKRMAPFENGRVHTIVFQKAGEELKAWLDDQLIFEHFEPLILRGPGHRTFSLNCTGAHTTRHVCDGLRVLRRRPPELVRVTEVPVGLLRSGKRAAAREHLEDILTTHAEPTLRAEAAYLLWTIYVDEGETDKAEEAAAQLVQDAPDSPYRWKLHTLRAVQHLEHGRFAQVVDAIREGPDGWQRGMLGRALKTPVKDQFARIRSSGPEMQEMRPVLRNLAYRHLDLTFSPIEDLRPLACMPLESLVLNCCRDITSLTPLRDMPALRELHIGEADHQTLDPLHGMKLTRLNCANTSIASLQPLTGMLLADLNCSRTRIESLEPLRGMPLTMLQVQYSRVSSLEPLCGMPLTMLACSSNPIVSGLEPLRGAPLRSLSCEGNSIEDLGPLAGMPLVLLACSANRIVDLSPLAGIRLTGLNCSQNQVSSLEPLRGMPLKVLDCGQNRITTLEPLQGMPLAFLRCWDNPLQSLGPMVEAPPPEFYFACSSLPDAEYARAMEVWSHRKAWSHHAEQAKILLALRHGDTGTLRSCAATYGGHQYLPVPCPVPWEEAKALAEEVGGQLATIADNHEGAFLQSLRDMRSKAWIGLRVSNGVATWVTGEPFVRDAKSSAVASKSGSGILADTSWQVVGAEREYPFIIEWQDAIGGQD